MSTDQGIRYYLTDVLGVSSLLGTAPEIGEQGAQRESTPPRLSKPSLYFVTTPQVTESEMKLAQKMAGALNNESLEFIRGDLSEALFAKGREASPSFFIFEKELVPRGLDLMPGQKAEFEGATYYLSYPLTEMLGTGPLVQNKKKKIWGLLKDFAQI